MTRTSRQLAIGLSVALALGACSDAATAPSVETDATLDADVANQAADGVGEDVQTMRDLNDGIRTGVMFLSVPATAPQGCPYNSSTGWHVCDPRTVGPLTIVRQYAFYDAGGTAEENFDAELTASIHLTRTVDGSIDRDTDKGTVTGEIHHDRDLTATGLAGDETTRTWNGTGHSDVSHSRVVDGRGSRSYEWTADVTVDNVVVPHGSADQDPWPLSGTITKHVVGTVTVNDKTRSFDRTVVVTFDGTQFPTVTVTGSSTSTFQIDLGNRRIRKP